MTKVEVLLCLIGLALFFHGLWTLLPAAAEIAGGLFLVGSAGADISPPKKEGRG